MKISTLTGVFGNILGMILGMLFYHFWWLGG